MSLHDFQAAVCELVASPELCRSAVSDPRNLLGRYQLTEREQRRLIDMVQQRGMSVNCTLYRFNRVTPLYTLMPLTSFVLGDCFISEVELFWSAFRETDLRFKQEIDRFGDFLNSRLSMGEIDNPWLAETLGFELASNDLRFVQRHQILEELAASGEPARENRPVHVHPLVRVVAFQHEPSILLKALKERRFPPQEPEAEYWLLLDRLQDELQVRKIDPVLGRLLRAIDERALTALPFDTAGVLFSADLIAS